MPEGAKSLTSPPRQAGSFALRLLREARAGWRMIRRPREVVIDGLRLPIDQKLCSPAIRREIYFETYEQDERRLIPDLITSEDRVLELGAGIGLVTATIIKASPAASLHIEANKDLIPAIRETLAANDMDAEVRHSAIVADDFVGTDVDLLTGAEFWSSSLHQRDNLDRATKVPALRLGDVLQTFRPSVLVIDVEGAECNLLTGAALAGVRAISVELHARITGVFPQKRMVQSLLAEGFHIDFTSTRNESVLFLRNEDSA